MVQGMAITSTSWYQTNIDGDDWRLDMPQRGPRRNSWDNQRKLPRKCPATQFSSLSFDLHGVVDGETRNDGSTGTIDVQVDGLVAVLA